MWNTLISIKKFKKVIKDSTLFTLLSKVLDQEFSTTTSACSSARPALLIRIFKELLSIPVVGRSDWLGWGWLWWRSKWRWWWWWHKSKMVEQASVMRIPSGWSPQSTANSPLLKRFESLPTNLEHFPHWGRLFYTVHAGMLFNQFPNSSVFFGWKIFLHEERVWCRL